MPFLGAYRPPIIDANFLNEYIPSGLRFTRANATATYFDRGGILRTAAANQPRFDYNPFTLAQRGLLMETSRVNVCIQSTALTSTNWTGSGITVPGAMDQTGIDGATSASTLTEAIAAVSHSVANNGNFSFVNATTYAQSWYVKPGTATRCQVTFNSGAFGTGQYANFGLTGAGSILASSGGTATIEQSANGFYRITWAAAATSSTSGSSAVLAFIDSDAATRLPTYLATGLTLIVASPQTEAGGYCTSYIPTTTASVTRIADALLKYQSTLRPQRQFSAYIEFIANSPTLRSNSAYLLYVDDQTANARLTIRACDVPSNFSPIVGFGNGSGISALTSSTALTHLQLVKLAMSIVPGINRLYQNGSSVAANTLNSLAIGRMPIGICCDSSAGRALDGWVRKFKYFSGKYSDAEMVSLTS